MQNLNNVKLLIKEYGIKPNKKNSQNFLTNYQIINKIINKIPVNNKNIVEIGPGLGSLTFSLLEKVNSLIAYEIDPILIKILKEKITNHKFILKEENFLNSKFEWNTKKDIIANIPYHITSDIIFKILHNLHKFSSATLMVQKEVGNRIMSKPNEKQYGKLAVIIQSIAKVTKVIDVSKNNFFPQPKVDSIVINLKFNQDFNYKYALFIKKCFAFRRKKFVNNLKEFLNVEQINFVFAKLNFPHNIRPQEISVKDFKKIFNLIF